MAFLMQKEHDRPKIAKCIKNSECLNGILLCPGVCLFLNLPIMHHNTMQKRTISCGKSHHRPKKHCSSHLAEKYVSKTRRHEKTS